MTYPWRLVPLLVVLVLLIASPPRDASAAASQETLITEKLTRGDNLLADVTVQKALETVLSGKSMFWSNKWSGNSGTVTLEETYRTQTGRYCRIYLQMVTVKYETEVARATACRDRNGLWRQVN